MAETGGRMKVSTMGLALCFALSPLAAGAMVQRREILRQIQRQAAPIAAIGFVDVISIADGSHGRMPDPGYNDSNDHS